MAEADTSKIATAGAGSSMARPPITGASKSAPLPRTKPAVTSLRDGWHTYKIGPREWNSGPNALFGASNKHVFGQANPFVRPPRHEVKKQPAVDSMAAVDAEIFDEAETFAKDTVRQINQSSKDSIELARFVFDNDSGASSVGWSPGEELVRETVQKVKECSKEAVSLARVVLERSAERNSSPQKRKLARAFVANAVRGVQENARESLSVARLVLARYCKPVTSEQESKLRASQLLVSSAVSGALDNSKLCVALARQALAQDPKRAVSPDNAQRAKRAKIISPAEVVAPGEGEVREGVEAAPRAGEQLG